MTPSTARRRIMLGACSRMLDPEHSRFYEHEWRAMLPRRIRHCRKISLPPLSPACPGAWRA